MCIRDRKRECIRHCCHRTEYMRSSGIPNRNWKVTQREEMHMQRSGFNIMTRLIGLVKALRGYMILAVAMGAVSYTHLVTARRHPR